MPQTPDAPPANLQIQALNAALDHCRRRDFRALAAAVDRLGPFAQDLRTSLPPGSKAKDRLRV